MEQPIVSIIIPVIRPKKAERCISAIHRCRNGIPVEILTKKDKKRIGCPLMVKQLVEKSQCNLVMYLGDDTVPLPGFLENAIKAMETLPDKWGLVGLNDQFHTGGNLATHWLAHKNLLPKLGGEFFHTGYRHTMCDVELTERCRMMNRYVWAEDAKIKHDHPYVTGNRKQMDKDYERVYSNSWRSHDEQLYHARKHTNWGHREGITHDAQFALPQQEAKIACCMIMKNEAKNLEKCLDSVRTITHEINIVDTGSTDDSIEIAKRLGARVIERPWENDFALHRNQSIEMASPECDWIVIIDCDEILYGEKHKLKFWLNNELEADADAVAVTMVDYKEGREAGRFAPAKIFRRKHFKGFCKPIHETPMCNNGTHYYTSLVWYGHYGYDVNPELKSTKLARNEKLLLEYLEDNPEDYGTWFYLSMHAGWADNIPKAIEYGLKYISHKKDLGDLFKYSIFFSVSRWMIGAGNYGPAGMLLKDAMKERPDDIDFLFALLELGIHTKNAQLITSSALAYLQSYQRFASNQQVKKGAEFTFTYTPVCLSFVSMQLAMLKLGEAAALMHNLNDATWKHCPADHVESCRQQIHQQLENCRFSQLAGKATDSRIIVPS
jgi:glycosyltransferase involved in cell wall biosynthesis